MIPKFLPIAVAAMFLAGGTALAQTDPKGVTEKAGSAAGARESCEKLSDAAAKERCLRDVGSSAAGAGTGSTGLGGSSSGVVGGGGTTGSTNTGSATSGSAGAPAPRSGSAK
jgi:hypothetical protein